MTVSNLLFAFESELMDYRDAVYFSDEDDETRQSVADLLGCLHAVRMPRDLDTAPRGHGYDVAFQ